MRRLIAAIIFVLGLTATPLFGQTTLTITGTVSNAGCPYAGGSGQATLVSGNGSGTANWLVGTSPVQNPRPIYSLDSFGHFSMTLTNTSSISPGSFDPQWQFSFCSFDYPNSGKACFTMTPMSLTSSQDISAAIQSQSAPIPACGGGSSGITFEHNGTVVATEPKYNVNDTGTAVWTVVDDPGNQRVNASIAAAGGGGGTPCGAIYDVQINNPLGQFGCDTGILVGDPTTHTLSDNIVNANQQVDVSDATHSGLLCQGHSTGSAIDAAYCTIPSTTFSPTPTGGYGIFPPDNSPTTIGQGIVISSTTPTNIATAYGTLPFYPTEWGTPNGKVSAEDRQYLFNNTACNDPATCSDIPFTPIGWSPNVAFMGPPTNTDGLGFLSNTANWNASVAQLTHSVTLPNVINTGDPLVAIFSSGTSVSGIADTCGNTFIHSTPSGWHYWIVAHAVACTTLDTITVTLTGNDGGMLLAGEVINGGDLDTSAGGPSCSGSGPHTITFAAVTTSTADILVGLAFSGDNGTGSYQSYFPSNNFTIENQRAAFVGGLGTNRSMMLGWQPAATVGSNQIAISGDALPGGTFICPDTATLAFKPASTGVPGAPTPRLPRLLDLQASGDFGGLADGNFYWYSGNSRSLVAGSFGSGLSLNESTGVLTASVTTPASIYLAGADSGTSGTNYLLTSGNLNANSNACPASLTTGVTATIIPAHANSTTTPTFQLCGLSSAATIVKGTAAGQTALASNDMLTTLPARLQYDSASTTWILQNPAQGGAGVTSVSGTANQIDSTGGSTPVLSLDGQFTSVTYGTCTNTADALTVTLSPAPTSLVNGLTVSCKSSAANTTTTPTLNVNSLGAKTIVKSGASGQAALVASDILTNMVATFKYNAATTTWELQNPQQASSSGLSNVVMPAAEFASSITGSVETVTKQVQSATYKARGPYKTAAQVPFIVSTTACAGSNSTSSTTCTLNSATQAGDALVVTMAGAYNIGSSQTMVANPGSISGTCVAAAHSSFQTDTDVCYLINVPAGITSVTVNVGNTPNVYVVDEYTNVATASALDTSTNGPYSGCSGGLFTVNSATTSNANDLLLGGVGTSGSTPYGAGPGWILGNTSVQAGGGGVSVASDYLAVTVTGTYAPVFTCSGSLSTGQFVALKAFTGSPSGQWFFGPDAASDYLTIGIPVIYNHSSTVQNISPHIVADTCTLGTSCSVTLTGNSIFTSSTSYQCTATDQTSAAAVKFSPSSGTAFALTGTGTDVIGYICVGN